MTMIPYGRQWIDEDDVQQVVEVLRGDFLTTGPAVNEFESALAAIATARSAVAVNSGTAALHAAYFAAGLKPGDEIITSPLTFAATANAALYLGATVRFVDIEPTTGNIDPDRIEEAITQNTRLIVPVDYAGHPADYDRINAVASEHGITVVADAAHSFGATYKGEPVGVLADLTATSFHPVKPFTSGEGGAVLTNRDSFAKAAAQFRTHGIVREVSALEDYDGPWTYEMHQLGYNYRLTDIQCALGLSQLRKLPSFLERRRAIANQYTAAFSGIPELVLPADNDDIAHGWHLYVIRVADDPSRRRAFFERLRTLGVGVQVHYLPVYLHPYYKNLGYTRGLCPLAEEFYARAVSIPMYPKMSDAEVEYVVERVEQAVIDVLR